MEINMLEFYNGKKVFITGHTGFKGSWLSKILIMSGAKICGFSQLPSTKPALFDILNIGNDMVSIIGDIRDLNKVEKAIRDFKPDIVFHLAAQPIVRESYKNPVDTFETNIMGTVNLLEAIRNCKSVKSVVNVTTDKVYENKEWEWGYRENEQLNGFDPYSNSKSCSELVTSSYKNSFFSKQLDISISTARAGNVIGGGDFSVDRIVPDCIKAAIQGENIIIRNPNSIRPYQHVFEALSAYLLIAERQYNNKSFEGCYNIGPNEEGCVTSGELANIFCRNWPGTKWIYELEANAKHEANFLKLDCSKIKAIFGWKPSVNIDESIRLTVEWTKAYIHNYDIQGISENQILEFFKSKEV
ncbi:MAG: CDP-glucose 4,6-dehydratase [Clostridium beijerinckii]|nr:CDP-glucose 4,6-dehydratase [Clostridium beijerinckii]MCI1583142.1 CDP-glucose 4,6-dehydratase [Clostridium beijerinckii]